MIARHAYFQMFLAVSTGIQTVSSQYHPLCSLRPLCLGAMVDNLTSLFSSPPQSGGSGSHPLCSLRPLSLGALVATLSVLFIPSVWWLS